MDDTQDVFARNLTKMLQHKGWTDNELARQSGVSNRSIGMYQKRDVAAGIEAVYKIARAFGVEPWEMLHPDFDPERMKDSRFPKVVRAFLVATESESALLDAQSQYILSHHTKPSAH